MFNRDSKIAILGFGLEGKDVLGYFLGKGCKDLTVLDQKSRKELDLGSIDALKINFRLGDDYLRDLSDFDVIFRSPGVYRYLPEIIKAQKKRVVITSAINFFLQNCPARTIGVTGTKGKGTTSTLIYEILQRQYGAESVFLAGNIGRPPLEVLDKLNKNSIVVLELSSFQLIDLQVSPNISVILNITLDHMDWHKNIKEYVDAKKNIVKFQTGSDSAVVNADYPISRSFEKLGNGKKYYFSLKKQVKGAYVKDDVFFLNISEKADVIGSTEKLILRGKHNQENICAAVCASALAGASADIIQKAVYSFKGLEHRLEFVRKVKEVSFYNDSFSTNPQTVEAAVKSFDEPTTLILGGFDKKLDYGGVFRSISSKKNIKTVVLIGDMRNVFIQLLRKHKFGGDIINLGYASMKEIVKTAYKYTPKGGVVVLSPGCSSFDMFESYKDRGGQFKAEVNKLSQ